LTPTWKALPLDQNEEAEISSERLSSCGVGNLSAALAGQVIR